MSIEGVKVRNDLPYRFFMIWKRLCRTSLSDLGAKAEVAKRAHLLNPDDTKHCIDDSSQLLPGSKFCMY